ncbi:hypothetical protein [Actinomadura sp. 3N508]|uniref:hypothetical protein n=1 Tax=Actinomadura sp. 3N508 TaxID=3375153 RepID=UPI0037A83F4B
MTAEPYPRLVEEFPELVAEIVQLLRAEGDPLAGSVEDLPFCGRCTCTPACENLLTAPVGSGSPYMAELRRDGETIFWLSLDLTGTAITAIEVLDGRDLFSAL